MSQCDSCGRNTKEKLVRTVTGRHLCQSCHDKLQNTAVGIVAAGSDRAGPAHVEAAARADWIERLKRLRRGKPS